MKNCSLISWEQICLTLLWQHVTHCISKSENVKAGCVCLKPFSDMTCGKSLENWVRNWPRVCFTHMNNTEGGSLHRRLPNSNKSSALFSWEVEPPGAARVNSTAEITGFSWQHTNTWHLHLCVFYVCHTAFSLGDICFPFSFFFIRFASVAFLQTLYNQTRQRKSADNPEPLTFTFTCSSSGKNM